MKTYPVLDDIRSVGNNNPQGTIQYYTREIPPQVDATYTNEQVHFLNELVSIKVHELNQKLDDINHKANACGEAQSITLQTLNIPQNNLPHP